MQNVLIAVIFIGTSTIVVIFFRVRKIINFPALGDNIVMFGDSLTVGIGSTEGNDIASLLSKKIKKPVTAMGVRRETTAQGLMRIDEVINKKPDVVMVLFGGNDFLQGVSEVETFKNLDTIVQKLQEAGAVVILLGIQGGIITDPYSGNFKLIAKNRGALYVPNVLDGIIGVDELMFDEVHPNDIGYKIIADKIYPILKKAF
ncbi:arylesterase [Candidatus Gracilibacteria bacterium]|nr:arylesterase [Candidatus Gracilibacteria bacterium]MCF7898345.1 arylesterase [Candidatus Paceibacterota bacterium]